MNENKKLNPIIHIAQSYISDIDNIAKQPNELSDPFTLNKPTINDATYSNVNPDIKNGSLKYNESLKKNKLNNLSNIKESLIAISDEEYFIVSNEDNTSDVVEQEVTNKYTPSFRGKRFNNNELLVIGKDPYVAGIENIIEPNANSYFNNNFVDSNINKDSIDYNDIDNIKIDNKLISNITNTVSGLYNKAVNDEINSLINGNRKSSNNYNSNYTSLTNSLFHDTINNTRITSNSYLNELINNSDSYSYAYLKENQNDVNELLDNFEDNFLDPGDLQIGNSSYSYFDNTPTNDKTTNDEDETTEEYKRATQLEKKNKWKEWLDRILEWKSMFRNFFSYAPYHKKNIYMTVSYLQSYMREDVFNLLTFSEVDPLLSFTSGGISNPFPTTLELNNLQKLGEIKGDDIKREAKNYVKKSLTSAGKDETVNALKKAGIDAYNLIKSAPSIMENICEILDPENIGLLAEDLTKCTLGLCKSELYLMSEAMLKSCSLAAVRMPENISKISLAYFDMYKKSAAEIMYEIQNEKSKAEQELKEESEAAKKINERIEKTKKNIKNVNDKIKQYSSYVSTYTAMVLGAVRNGPTFVASGLDSLCHKVLDNAYEFLNDKTEIIMNGISETNKDCGEKLGRSMTNTYNIKLEKSLRWALQQIDTETAAIMAEAITITQEVILKAMAITGLSLPVPKISSLL